MVGPRRYPKELSDVRQRPSVATTAPPRMDLKPAGILFEEYERRYGLMKGPVHGFALEGSSQ
jgi:hypothetical protein